MNKKQEIRTDKLHLAALKYFDEKHRGVELSGELSYAFLVEVKDDLYINPFSPLEMYPVLKRLPYSNYTRSGEGYGSKMKLVSGEAKSGPCYVLYNEDMERTFGSDVVTIEDLEKYIVNSSYYFKDRADILENRGGDILTRITKYVSIVSKDEKDAEKMNTFFEERGVQLQKVR